MKLLLLNVLCLLVSITYAQRTQLTIEVVGLQNRKGQIVLDIFQTEKGFPIKTEHAIQRQILKISADGKLEFIVNNLIEGEYAFALFHDENSNGKLDLNFIGIPKEGAAASNNAKGFMSPPSYDEAKFQLKKETVMAIKILYF